MSARTRLAKLSVPRTSGALPRLRLHRLLDAAMQRAGAAWIAAGPGAGKSTLAAAWASARPGRVLWYRADEGDADPAAAFSYFQMLAGATQHARTLPRYTARDLDRLDLFARTFFRAFFEIVAAASTLVVDDAHAVGGETFGALLTAAVREAPQDVALLILSRHDPAGVVLEAIAAGQVEVLDASTLSFTPDEAATLLADRMDTAAARRLHARTDGWAAGMLLLAQSEGPADIRPTERIASYFDERVLAPFDTFELKALAAVGLLPEVDVDDLARMGLGDAAMDLLERLRKRHAFVVRLDRQPPSWRLHDLLRDALAVRFDSIGDVHWRLRVTLAAADIASRRGLAREAVRLLVRAGDAAGALNTAERFGRALVRAQRLTELDAVTSALEPAVVNKSMPLELALGDAAWQRNDARTAVAHFERAWALAGTSTPNEHALLIAASALGAILEGWQDYGGVDEWVRRLRANVDARRAIHDASDALRVDSVCVRAMSMVFGERLGDYHALVDRVLDVLRHAPHGVVADEAVASSGVLLEAAGYLLSYEHLFHETVAAASAWLSRNDLSPLTKAGWLNTYAMLGRRWPTPGVKLPAAPGYPSLELAVELATRHGGQSSAFTGCEFLTNAAVADNDREEAQRRLAALRDIADARHVKQMIELLEVESKVLALGGEWARAREASARTLALAKQHAYPLSEQWSVMLTRARIEIASGDPDEARAMLLREAERFPEGMRRDWMHILADVAEAAIAVREARDPPAELVERILRRAREYAWPGFGTLLAPIAARVCAEALRLGIEPEFARHCIRERHIPAPSSYAVHWPWPIRVHALGGMRVRVDDAPLAFGPRAQRKPLDLLKAVVAHGPQPVDTAVLLDALWPDAEGAAARAAFDMTLMRLRKLLGRDEALRLDAGHVALDPACVWVDAWAYAAGATDDYPGPLFGSDAVEPWWAAARERLHQRFLRRTLERAKALEHSGEHDAALVLYESALAQDPLAEDLYQGAIRCHLAAGRAADALRVFRRCREQLSIVLSIPPSAGTAALVAGLHAR